MTKAEQFAKLNKIHWYECHAFTDAKSILEVMMKRKDWEFFLSSIGGFLSAYGDGIEVMEVGYILNPDKLLDEAIKFCEENET